MNRTQGYHLRMLGVLPIEMRVPVEGAPPMVAQWLLPRTPPPHSLVALIDGTRDGSHGPYARLLAQELLALGSGAFRHSPMGTRDPEVALGGLWKAATGLSDVSRQRIVLCVLSEGADGPLWPDVQIWKIRKPAAFVTLNPSAPGRWGELRGLRGAVVGVGESIADSWKKDARNLRADLDFRQLQSDSDEPSARADLAHLLTSYLEPGWERPVSLAPSALQTSEASEAYGRR